MKKIIKKFIPPIFLDIYRFFKRKNTKQKKDYFSGDYSTWSEARNSSTGYDSPMVLEKVKTALLKVKKGEAIYEKDSILFDKIEYSWPLLANLLWVASNNKNTLNLIDFGGSLGTTYFQNINYLKHLDYLKWNIVEQKSFVDCGKKYFEDKTLHFFYSIEDCLKSEKPNAIILWGVLQYLENPYDFLEKLVSFNFKYIFIRTWFANEERDILKIQHLFPPHYEASFPSWFFNLSKFLSYFDEKYELLSEYELLSHYKVFKFKDFKFRKGFFFKQKDL